MPGHRTPGSLRALLAWMLFVAVTAAGCGGGPSDSAVGATPPEAGSGDTGAPDPLASLRAPDPDKVIATVNGVEIRAGKVYEVAALNLLNLEAQGRTFDEQEEAGLRMATLELVINDELMAQEADRRGLQVDPAEVDARIQAIRDQHGTASAFSGVLADAGLTEDEFRAEVERRLKTERYLEEITRDVRVSDEEAQAFYERFPERFSEGETVEVRQILVRSVAGDPEAKRTAARERAEEAHRRAVAGEDFAALAREFSQAPNAADGGLVSHFPRGVMVPQFEEVAFATEVGSVSEPFETAYGYNVVLVTDRKPAKRIPFAEVKPKLLVDLARAKEAMTVQAELRKLQDASDVRVTDPDFLPAPDEPAGETADSAESTPKGAN